MPGFMRHSQTLRQFVLYVLLLLMVKVFIEIHHFTTPIYIILSLFFLIPEVISEYIPEYLAWIYVNGKIVVGCVLLFCIGLGLAAYCCYPAPAGFTNFLEPKSPLLRVIVEGTLLGCFTRILLTRLFYQLIRARNVFIFKILILIVYMMFLIMLPLTDRYLLCPFFIACGVGFLIHYLTRVSERRNAQHSRLGYNLLSMIQNINKTNIYTLTSNEEKASRLFVRQQWKKLRRFLNSRPETVILFFIKLSMHTKLHEYDSALNLLAEKEKENPSWYAANKQFIYLHRALNRFKNGGDRHAISDDFSLSIRVDGSCLLSNALLALKLANEIDTGANDYNSQESRKNREESLKLIRKAMKIYEERERGPHPISLIIGMTIPCTYSFLLDTYGYVLLKDGELKFARSLFVQCLYQDPSFSTPYLHLAEWYAAYYKNGESKNEHWRKAARLNLHIAILNEKLDSRNGNVSIVAAKATALLATL